MRIPVVLLLLTGCLSEDSSGPIPPDQRPSRDDGDTGFIDDEDTDQNEDTDTEPEEDPIWEEACHPDLEGWKSGWADFEEKVVELINEARSTSTNCGSEGVFPATGSVVMEAHLRCAARYHSLWMADTNSFSHDSPGGDLGEDPWERIDSTGFSGFAVGENIAAGYGTPRSVVEGWLDSDGHCSNLMNPDATLTGVGYYAGGYYGHYWTQNFGQ